MDIIAELKRLPPAGVVVACVAVGWYLSLFVYRLHLHPLAKFPGPKLAALSKWYEFHYEVVQRGQFSRHISELHEKYGPVVRITPHELHVKDSSLWDTLYAKHPKTDKYAWMNGRFGNHGSIFTTSDQALHRLRRSALNPMFSKRAIGQFEPFVRGKVDFFCDRIAKYKGTGEVLAVNKLWNAYAGDVITEYSFGFNYDHLASEDFKETFHDAFMAVSEFGHIALQFPWVTPLLNMLPDDMVQKMNPPLEKLLQLQRDLQKTIFRIGQERDQMDKQPKQPTIFHEILQSDLPSQEKMLKRLGDEAQTIIGAGLTTTAWALTNIMYYVLADTQIHATLRKELHDAVPDLSSPDALSFQKLEQLPFLRACIREGIRLSHGVTARNPRVLSVPLTYDEWTIPPQTPVSMTITDVHFDPEIYPNPTEFVPDRWMSNPKAQDGNSLDRYFVAFGKGPRLCLGINLAYLELFTAIGSIFRRFRFELYETDLSDVIIVHDFFLPSPKLDSKGVRVKVVNVES
ncbi:cytochrome P450, variant [Eremomyces bilateralis CBS 781.70]|uniref:Cytochrome P450, variant n=1 Tax=Eremomyces bilateralis CBS 781.70 TaxID=1392243 RepID=A0A6G1G8J5_9PEZI|nr:cytochrome P450, variant [Eremomyces bilateralis CBS 781.70]KAF1814179.1 cytochrome P450, variant [Eremomyces bilateralis CBS 781.70]